MGQKIIDWHCRRPSYVKKIYVRNHPTLIDQEGVAGFFIEGVELAIVGYFICIFIGYKKLIHKKLIPIIKECYESS